MGSPVDPARAPVIIGVAQIADRPAHIEDARTTAALIADAVRAAFADTGAAIGPAAADWVGIVDALARDDRPAPLHPTILSALGIAPRHAESSPSPSGNSPLRLLDDLAGAIADGEADIGIVAGGEAMRSFTRAARNGSDVIRAYRGDTIDLPARYGLVTPLDVYPLYEQATRHAWGQTAAEAAAESGAIWAGNARVAALNPAAWLRYPPEPAAIVAANDRNPMLSYPYRRLMVANSGVNQAAALVVTSLGRALALGIPRRRLAFVGLGAAASEPAANLDRATFAQSPAMRASIGQALARNRIAASALDHVELYSCFPCVPKMARRILGWPLDRPHSLYGGLTFGGGPIGNGMTHALAALVGRIRAGSRNGLIFANGGFATKNHTILLGAAPPPADVDRAYDVQAEADRLRGPIPPLLDDYAGPARIETYSVPYRDGKPSVATIVARTPDGGRALARVAANDDPALARLVDPLREPVGATGHIVPGDDGLNHWRFA